MTYFLSKLRKTCKTQCKFLIREKLLRVLFITPLITYILIMCLFPCLTLNLENLFPRALFFPTLLSPLTPRPFHFSPPSRAWINESSSSYALQSLQTTKKLVSDCCLNSCFFPSQNFLCQPINI